jgi:hypothetical protein
VMTFKVWRHEGAKFRWRFGTDEQESWSPVKATAPRMTASTPCG